MKFGHLLKTFEADAATPDTVCVNYKKLKKLIKAQTKQQQEAAAAAGSAVPPAPAADGVAPTAQQQAVAGEPAAAPAAADAVAAAAAEQGGAVAEEDREFVATLSADLAAVNAHFMEREEEAVMALAALEERLGAAQRRAAPPPELDALRNEMVDFHGELVLLLHWSLVNYAAVAKILKKHDKLTGSRLRAPVLASVLHQPFLSTESISQLVKTAERHVQELAALCGPPGSAGHSGESSGGVVSGSGGGGEADDSDSHVAIFKRTRAALNMVKEMQETASTPSTLLPPAGGSGEVAPDGKKARVVGQGPARGAAAKAAA